MVSDIIHHDNNIIFSDLESDIIRHVIRILNQVDPLDVTNIITPSYSTLTWYLTSHYFRIRWIIETRMLLCICPLYPYILLSICQYVNKCHSTGRERLISNRITILCYEKTRAPPSQCTAKPIENYTYKPVESFHCRATGICKFM